MRSRLPVVGCRRQFANDVVKAYREGLPALDGESDSLQFMVNSDFRLVADV